MKWSETKINDNSILQTLILNSYTLQAQLIEKINIFDSQNLFGNYDIIISAFNYHGKLIESKSINGLNGNIKQAKNNLEKIKNEFEMKYNIE